MSKRTVAESHKVAVSIKPASHAVGTTNGAAADCKGYDDTAVVIDCGVFTATGDLTAKVQESDDGSTGWADVAGAAFANKEQADDELPYVGNQNLAKRKRHLRVVFTVSDDAVIASALFILGAAISRPVTQTNAVEFKI